MMNPSVDYTESTCERASLDEASRKAICYLRWARLAQAVFLIYLFFLMFGTSPPFPENSHDIDDKSTSNIITQIVYLSLFALSLCCLIPVMKQALVVIWRERFMTLFLLWALMTVLWSDVISVSTKRFIQLVTAVMVSLTALIYARESKYTLCSLLYILALYMFTSLLAILLIPEAIDPSSNTWRGMALSKNHFGQAMVVSTLAWCLGVRAGLVRYRILGISMALLSVVMLVGASSTTSAIALSVVAIGGAAWWLASATMLPAAAKTLFILCSSAFIVPVAFSYVHTPEIFNPLFELVERNASFTGRTELWSFVWEHASSRLLTGCGYGAFWTTSNVDLLFLYDYFVWLPNQSHMGYLDILNELGLVGIGLFICMLGAYLLRLMRTVSPHIWVWFIAAALIINTQESTLFRPSVLTGFLFLHGYLALTVDTLKFRGDI